jgi:Mrp family chromosome partitioning ATPase/capsular polysaccharide biosynthesis protein
VPLGPGFAPRPSLLRKRLDRSTLWRDRGYPPVTVDTLQVNPPHISDYVRPVWQRKWLVIFVVVLATAATYAYAHRQPKVYNAGTLVFYLDPGDPLTGAVTTSPDRNLQDLASLLYSQNVAALVAKRLNYSGSPGVLASQVTITTRPNQDFIAISGAAHTPTLAAAIANGYAEEFVTLTNNNQRQRVNQSLQLARRQLAQTGGGVTGDAARLALETQIGKLQADLLTVPGANTRQVNPAVAPATPTSPQPVRDAIFAFVLGFVFSVSVAFALERFDRRLKKPEDLEQGYGLPILTVLPHSADPAPSVDGVVGLGPGFHEAFGLLRTNLQLLTLDAPAHSIVVVSAIPGEGKSTIVRSLAIAMCEAGHRVAVVEADLRRPMQSGLFGLPAGPGLAEILTGDATLNDVLHSVPARARGVEALTRMAGRAGPEEPSANGHAADPESGSAISVLLSGGYPANPSTVLESERVRDVFDQLRATHDVLILDSAPLLSVTDSVPLVRYADVTVIVGRLGLTTRDNVRRMIEFLGRVRDAHVLGVVANDLAQLEATGYGYSYGYGYGYGGYGGDAAMRSKPRSKRFKRAPSAPPAEHV